MDTQTLSAQLTQGLALLLLSAATGAVGLLMAWLKAKTASVSSLKVLGQATEVASSVVAHVETSMRPLIQKALADGRLDKTEQEELKRHAMELFRASLGTAGLDALRKALGLSGAEAVTTYASGLLERTLAVQNGALGPQTPPGSP